MPRKYPIEFRQRALRLLEESREQHGSEFAAIEAISSRLGIAAETLRRWARRDEVDAGARPGTTSEDSYRRFWNRSPAT